MEHYNNTHNYLMYFKSKRIMDSNFQPSMDLWEDHAPIGGFVWPPRSYSCSFCRREFRSAQALGGHMNVHRRDRARLKQSPSPQLSEKNETLLLRERAHPSPSESHRISFLDIKNFQREVTGHSTIFLDQDHTGGDHEIGSSVAIDHFFVETTDDRKRRKKTSCVAPPSPFPHGTKACSSNRYGRISPIEDIDLELRLGDPQTVK